MGAPTTILDEVETSIPSILRATQRAQLLDELRPRMIARLFSSVTVPSNQCLELNMLRFFILLAVFGLAVLISGPRSASSQDIEAKPCTSSDPQISDNEAWTSKSWSLFNSGDYAGTVRNVNACLANWEPVARQTQADMTAMRAPCPPVGKVDDGAKASIFQNGLLNDVATNLFILGRSNQALGNPDAARAAYESCASLQCARTWDPRGFFWSPALDCRAQLAN